MGKKLSGTNKKNIFFGGGTPWGVTPWGGTPWGVTQVGVISLQTTIRCKQFFLKVIEVFEIVIDEIE